MAEENAHHVQRVIDTDAHTQGDHRQRGDFHADVQPDHQGFAEDGRQHQRNHRAQGRAPGAEGDQAQQNHRTVDPDEHLAVGLLDDDIGRGFDAGIARGQEELHLVGVIRGGKFFHVLDQPGQCLGLVVSEVGVQGQQAAVFVVQAAWCAGGDHVEHRLIVLQLVPLRVAFTEPDQHAPVEQRQRVGRIHARQGTQLPVQGVDLGEDVVAGATAGRGFHHHRKQVAAGAVVTGQIGIVLVVARIRAQLRRPGVEVANFQLQADHKTQSRQRQADGDAQAGPATMGEQVEKTPKGMACLTGLLGLLTLEAQLCRAR
ncbi:hypothetical protein D3C84_662880 [compost metagenome]